MKFKKLSLEEAIQLNGSDYVYEGHKSEHYAVMDLQYMFGQHRITVWFYHENGYPEGLIPHF